MNQISHYQDLEIIFFHIFPQIVALVNKLKPKAIKGLVALYLYHLNLQRNMEER